jgi:hypothetical protein
MGVVEIMNYPPLQIVVSGNDDLVFLPPSSVFFGHLVGICPARNLLLAVFFLLVLYYPLLEGPVFAIIQAFSHLLPRMCF